MKLKKLLAAVVSAALAVSTMAVSSLPVSAAGKTEEITVALNDSYEDQYNSNGETCYSFQKEYTGEANWTDYTTAVFTVDVGTLAESVTNISFYCINSSWGEVSGTKTYMTKEQVSGNKITATIDFTSLSDDAIGSIKSMILRIETNSTSKVTDYGLSNGKITLTQKEGVVIVPKDEWVTNADGKKEFTRGSTAFDQQNPFPNLELAIPDDIAKDKVTKITVNATATGQGAGVIGVNNVAGTWTTGAWETGITNEDISLDIEGIGSDQTKVLFQIYWANAGAKITVNSIDFTTSGGDEPTPTEKTITLSPETLNLTVGGNGTITATTTPAGETVTWTSSDPAVATVDGGVVTAVAAGTATITAAIDGATPAVSDTCAVTVTAEDEPTPDNPDEPTPDNPDDPTPDNPDNPNPPTPSDEHNWATEWSKDETNHWHACTDADCTEKNDLAAHTFNGGEVTTPATATTAGVKTYTCTVCGQTKTEAIPATGSSTPVRPSPSPAPSTPSSDTNMGLIGVAPAASNSEPSITGKDGQTGWNAITKEVADTSTGKVSVDMNSSTQLPKDVVESIKDTDVDLVLNLDNGITWTINGSDVTAAQTVDMDVTKNTHNIPKEAIKTATGKTSARQISLAHDGNFGFAAKMTISLGKVNNGQYANLFYYNPKTKALEFVDAGIIKNGKANLVFTHASDYAIVIDEEPLGTYEDVAAAAGITSSEDMSSNTVVYAVCGVSVFAVLGVLISLKRRYQK